MKWQSIESAPVGEDVLLHSPDCDCAVVIGHRFGVRERAPDIAKIIRKDDGKRVELSCDFGLVYRLLIASAPVHL